MYSEKYNHLLDIRNQLIDKVLSSNNQYDIDQYTVALEHIEVEIARCRPITQPTYKYNNNLEKHTNGQHNFNSR